MTTKTVKVGDVVAWDDVPSGAMCNDGCGSYCLRLCDAGHVVGLTITGFSNSWDSWSTMECIGAAWPWQEEDHPVAVIVALDLTGNETADELRALAEAFEREHPAT